MLSIEVIDGLRTIPHEIVVPSGQVPLTLRALHSLSDSHCKDPVMRTTLENIMVYGHTPEDFPDDVTAFHYHDLVNVAIGRLENYDSEYFTEIIRMRGTAVPLLRTAILGGLTLQRSIWSRRRAAEAEEMLANPVRMTWPEFESHKDKYPKAMVFNGQPRNWR